MREDRRRLCGVMSMIGVSVNRSGEKQSHAQLQTISGVGLTGSGMPDTRRMAHAHANGRNQWVTARVQPLFWRESDLSLASAGFCQIRNLVAQRLSPLAGLTWGPFVSRGNHQLARTPL
jgi:hypothetical protein